MLCKINNIPIPIENESIEYIDSISRIDNSTSVNSKHGYRLHFPKKELRFRTYPVTKDVANDLLMLINGEHHSYNFTFETNYHSYTYSGIIPSQTVENTSMRIMFRENTINKYPSLNSSLELKSAALGFHVSPEKFAVYVHSKIGTKQETLIYENNNGNITHNFPAQIVPSTIGNIFKITVGSTIVNLADMVVFWGWIPTGFIKSGYIESNTYWGNSPYLNFTDEFGKTTEVVGEVLDMTPVTNSQDNLYQLSVRLVESKSEYH
jgi:hypothetical protein